jgi:hypothetical protein
MEGGGACRGASAKWTLTESQTCVQTIILIRVAVHVELTAATN